MSVTAATVKREALWPALDAQAQNDRQALLLYNPTPEPDSAVEHAQALVSTHPRAAADLLGVFRQLVASNQLERDDERQVAGFADQLARQLRRAELDGTAAPAAALTARAVCHHLRGPLSTLLTPAAHDALAIVHAARTIERVMTTAPRAQLLSPAVAHNLGKAKFALLSDLADAREQATA